MRFQFVASEIAIGLRRNLTMTIAVVITTAVSLALVASAMLMRNQVELMKGFWFDKIEVTIFLCDAVTKSPQLRGRAVSIRLRVRGLSARPLRCRCRVCGATLAHEVGPRLRSCVAARPTSPPSALRDVTVRQLNVDAGSSERSGGSSSGPSSG